MKSIFLATSLIFLQLFALSKEQKYLKKPLGHKFEDLVLSQLKHFKRKKISVAAANDPTVLESIKIAYTQGIADAVLVGDQKQIEEMGKKLNMDLSKFEIINEPDAKKAAYKAVELVSSGKADMYMKGQIDTKTFLLSVLDKKVGLKRPRTRLSHICLAEVQGIDQLLFLTDVEFIMYPDLQDKINIIENTKRIVASLGNKNPKIAVLSAVEVVNPKMPETVDAQKLSELNDQGQIKDCIVDGPLSLDLAIDYESCVHKKATHRKIHGDADVLLFPNINAGNFVYSLLTHTTQFKSACMVTGLYKPVILTSRADSVSTRVNSIALASLVSEYLIESGA